MFSIHDFVILLHMHISIIISLLWSWLQSECFNRIKRICKMLVTNDNYFPFLPNRALISISGFHRNRRQTYLTCSQPNAYQDCDLYPLVMKYNLNYHCSPAGIFPAKSELFFVERWSWFFVMPNYSSKIRYICGNFIKNFVQ